jgi:hypothetical protein
MLVNFNFGHHDTIYPIVSLVVCNFLTNDMASFENTAPFAHDFHFSIISHELFVRIMNLSLLT